MIKIYYSFPLGTLICKLNDLGRTDASEEILLLAPLYIVSNYNTIDIIKSEDKVGTRPSKNNSVNKSSGSKIHTEV